MSIDLTSRVSGRYKIEAIRLDAEGNELSRRVCADWFNNLITDGGLDAMGDTSTYLTYCLVGSGNTPPATTDTALETFVAATNDDQDDSYASDAVNGYKEYTVTYRFAEGTAAGNLTEVGVGPNNTNTNLYSRALILDGGGLPTSITVLADEVLDVSYSIRIYVPLVDGSGIISISGVDYDYTTRVIALTSNNNPFGFGGWGVYHPGAPAGIRGTNGGENGAYDGAMVAITASVPTGLSSPPNSVASPTYVGGSLRQDGTQTYGLLRGNFVTGISVVKVCFYWCSYQVGFDPPIPKDSTQNLDLTFRHTWARH